jgi:hypothetical protein
MQTGNRRREGRKEHKVGRKAGVWRILTNFRFGEVKQHIACANANLELVHLDDARVGGTENPLAAHLVQRNCQKLGILGPEVRDRLKVAS